MKYLNGDFCNWNCASSILRIGKRCANEIFKSRNIFKIEIKVLTLKIILKIGNKLWNIPTSLRWMRRVFMFIHVAIPPLSRRSPKQRFSSVQNASFIIASKKRWKKTHLKLISWHFAPFAYHLKCQLFSFGARLKFIISTHLPYATTLGCYLVAFEYGFFFVRDSEWKKIVKSTDCLRRWRRKISRFADKRCEARL